jgi:hypothetical protein
MFFNLFKKKAPQPVARSQHFSVFAKFRFDREDHYIYNYQTCLMVEARSAEEAIERAKTVFHKNAPVTWSTNADSIVGREIGANGVDGADIQRVWDDNRTKIADKPVDCDLPMFDLSASVKLGIFARGQSQDDSLSCSMHNSFRFRAKDEADVIARLSPYLPKGTVFELFKPNEANAQTAEDWIAQEAVRKEKQNARRREAYARKKREAAANDE